MHALLAQALRGVDPGSPDAFWQIFRNLLVMLPWWWMLWSNLICVAGGAAIAHFRRSSIARAVAWALVLGPFGWILAWYAPSETRHCPRCGKAASPDRKRCDHCGCTLNAKPPPTQPNASS